MPTKKPKTPYAVHAKAHRWHVQDYVDQDYVDKLSPEEKQWLADFNDAHYSGKFTSPVGRKFPQETRREIYRDYHAAEKDARHKTLERKAVRAHDGEDIALDVADPSPDAEETPAYLNHPRYKRALQAWRNEPDIESGTNATGKRVLFVKAPSHRKAILKSQLDAIINLGRAGLLEDEE